MSILRQRIMTVGQVGPDLSIVGTTNGPTQIPLTRILIRPGYVTSEAVYPLFTPDGDIIVGTGPGQWAQLYAAGRT